MCSPYVCLTFVCYMSQISTRPFREKNAQFYWHVFVCEYPISLLSYIMLLFLPPPFLLQHHFWWPHRVRAHDVTDNVTCLTTSQYDVTNSRQHPPPSSSSPPPELKIKSMHYLISQPSDIPPALRTTDLLCRQGRPRADPDLGQDNFF